MGTPSLSVRLLRIVMQLEDIPLEVAFEIVQRAIRAGNMDVVASWLARSAPAELERKDLTKS